MQWVAQHRKLIPAVAVAVIAIATAIWGSGNPWVIVLVTVASAAGVTGVHQLPNAPLTAPAAPALPGSRPGGGLPVTGPVKVVPEPQPVQERVAQPPPPGPGVPPEGAA